MRELHTTFPAVLPRDFPGGDQRVCSTQQMLSSIDEKVLNKRVHAGTVYRPLTTVPPTQHGIYFFVLRVRARPELVFVAVAAAVNTPL